MHRSAQRAQPERQSQDDSRAECGVASQPTHHRCAFSVPGKKEIGAKAERCCARQSQEPFILNVPDTFKGNQYSIIQLMVTDAQYLPATVIKQVCGVSLRQQGAACERCLKHVQGLVIGADVDIDAEVRVPSLLLVA